MSESRHKERKVLRKFKGLNVTIRWKEHESYYEETIAGTYLLCVGSNQIKVKSQTIGRSSSTSENGSYFLNTSVLKINCD